MFVQAFKDLLSAVPIGHWEHFIVSTLKYWSEGHSTHDSLEESQCKGRKQEIQWVPFEKGFCYGHLQVFESTS